jgi:hypothetical protein
VDHSSPVSPHFILRLVSIQQKDAPWPHAERACTAAAGGVLSHFGLLDAKQLHPLSGKIVSISSRASLNMCGDLVASVPATENTNSPHELPSNCWSELCQRIYFNRCKTGSDSASSPPQQNSGHVSIRNEQTARTVLVCDNWKLPQTARIIAMTCKRD